MSEPASTLRFTKFLERFSSGDIEHAIPLLVATFLAAEPELVIPAPVQIVVLEWMTQSGLGPNATVSELATALAQTYAARPVNAELRLGLCEMFGELLDTSTESTRARSAALVGVARSTFEARAEPATGAVRASPIAAFALRGGS